MLVYGWYGRNNVGDELMKHALAGMMRPRGITLNFVDEIKQLLNPETGELVRGVIFGGGSILQDAPRVSAEALDVLLAGKVPVFYVGVGPETSFHPVHRKLMAVAHVVAFRDLDIPDLAYSLQAETRPLVRSPQGILVLPNVETIPTWEDAHWMHVAWEHYRNELAQALDHFIDRGITVTFGLMCSAASKEDAWAAAEIISRMKRRGTKHEVTTLKNGMQSTLLMRCHKAIITQRYHGIVLAEMAGVPYVAVEHHDKLKNSKPHRGHFMSFHGMTKATMIDAVQGAMEAQLEPHQEPRQVYDDLVDRIINVIGTGEPQWQASTLGSGEAASTSSPLPPSSPRILT